MQLYLPIADIPVNVFLILAMGAAVGFVSGMFGIGGGFLMTPLLIFVGIAPAVAVASVASHIAASSFSGALSYWRKRAIDPALAAVLLSLAAIPGRGDDAGEDLITLRDGATKTGKVATCDTAGCLISGNPIARATIMSIRLGRQGARGLRSRTYRIV